jgi:hypothetical protein
MTVRFLMIVVALAAVATYGGLVVWRAVSYSQRAESHRQHLQSAESFLGESWALREWHEQMRRKYEFAASHPWQATSPDPPPPR